jgi:hypothetical protein
MDHLQLSLSVKNFHRRELDPSADARIVSCADTHLQKCRARLPFAPSILHPARPAFSNVASLSFGGVNLLKNVPKICCAPFPYSPSVIIPNIGEREFSGDGENKIELSPTEESRFVIGPPMWFNRGHEISF